MSELNFYEMNLPAGFIKLMSGGNDFVLLDNLSAAYDRLLANPDVVREFVLKICARGYGIGGDGVIFCSRNSRHKSGEIAVRFFDSDGGEALFCGNGSACVTSHAIANSWCGGDEIVLHTRAGLARGEPLGNSRFLVFVPTPADFERGLNLTVRGKTFSADYLRVGVPHLVVPVDDVAKIDLQIDGAELRHHPHFAAVGGVNVNFVQVIREGEIKMRTFEVGVEDETLSCGSGSVAAAIATCERRRWKQKFQRGTTGVCVHSASGEKSAIRFNLSENNLVSFASLETSAHRVCAGEIAKDFFIDPVYVHSC